ncbi:hypothetical protein F898_02914 [Acinetobacter courvalinii]|nr:hypothetical protein F898_02914 [Acinetobacter courvalinii]
MGEFLRRLVVLSMMFLRISSSIGTIAKNSVRILLILMGVTWSALALAEGGCPEGQFPQQYGTTMGCTTMNAGGNQPVAPVWADRWGAIASDGNGIYGIVTDLPSKRKASKSAIQECKNRGGRTCALERAYYNQCAAVVMTDTWTAFANAPTLQQATEIGQRDCTASNTGSCRVYWSGCSMPVRVN